jgi:hypothetical protein
MKWPFDTEGTVGSISNLNTGTKAKIALLLGLGVVHVIITAFYVVPGHLLIDEIIYHWSVRDFSASGELSVWNGYEEFPSPELEHPFLSTHGGKLYTQYPMLFTALAVPFYELAGIYGLFILNAIAFLITVSLCFLTAKRLFEDADLALNTCLIFALATFAWEYSQAAWPHMISTCFAIAALYLFVCSYESASKKGAIVAAFGAGFVSGLGPGLRFDSIYVIPALVVPLVLSRRARVAELTAFIAGAAPGLLILSYINYLRFGVFSALADGHGLQMSLPLLFPFIAIPVAWIVNRTGVGDLVLNNKGKILLSLALLLFLALLLPQVRLWGSDLLHSAYVNTIDMRAFDEDINRPAMSRSEGAGVVYMGAQKKSLLQSMPFLALLVVPALGLFGKGNDSSKLFILLLLPATYIAGFAYTFHLGSYEGGLCLNLRYFLPVLPPLAILCAYAIKVLRRDWGVSFHPATVVMSGLGTAALYFLLVERFKTNVNDLVFPLLVLPLLLAVLLFCSTLICVTKAGRLIRTGKAVAALVAATLTWSGLVAFLYDYPVHKRQRATNYYTSKAALEVVPPDSLFFTAPYIDPFMGLLEQPRVRIAFPGYDHFRDFSRLLEFHLNSGRRCFAAFPERLWKELRKGPLVGHDVVRVMEWPGSFLGEISLAEGSRASVPQHR